MSDNPGERPPQGNVSEPLANNVDALMKRRHREAQHEGITQKLAAVMAAFTGSMVSVLVHGVIFGAWILVNTGVLPIVEPWDETLVVLAMIASVEAIFLTTFVLINQRQQARMEEDRAELTLQVSLLAEQETTGIAKLLIAIAQKLDVPIPENMGIAEITKAVTPDDILQEIERKRPG